MAEARTEHTASEKMTGHIIVCGLGHVGYRVVRLLRQMEEPVTVVTLEAREEWRTISMRMGARVLLGDARSLDRLKEAGIASARAVVIATDHDLINVEIALDVRRLREDVPIVIRLFDQTLARQFEAHFDIQRAVDMSEVAAPSFMAAALGARVSGSFTIHDIPYIVARVDLEETSPMVGRTVRQVHEEARLAALLYDTAGNGEPVVPDSETVLRAGDRITAVGSVFDWDKASPLPVIPRAPRLPRSTWDKLSEALHLPLWGTLVRQVWMNSPLALRSALVFLGMILALSVAVFHYTLDLSVVDAIYFMITTVTTTGYGDIHPGGEGPFVKLFASMVMLLGAAALAIIYSIIIDFVVTARFEQILGRHRFPRSGHVVVVGLGNVGFRIINELKRTGAQVVGVDRNADGPFVSTVRSHTPVYIGDARVLETLAAVSVKDASAVIAVTDDDAVNIGVGLLAEEVNGRVHTVVRLFDADFAHKIEVDLAIDKALSASRVAAPTFAASAIYPGVCVAFELDGYLFVVRKQVVDETWEGCTPARLRDRHGAIVIHRHPVGDRVSGDKDMGGTAATSPGSTPLARGEEVLAVIHEPLDPAWCQSLVTYTERPGAS